MSTIDPITRVDYVGLPRWSVTTHTRWVNHRLVRDGGKAYIDEARTTHYYGTRRAAQDIIDKTIRVGGVIVAGYDRGIVRFDRHIDCDCGPCVELRTHTINTNNTTTGDQS